MADHVWAVDENGALDGCALCGGSMFDGQPCPEASNRLTIVSDADPVGKAGYRKDGEDKDFRTQGLENDERTHDMGCNAHSTEVKVETEDAITTVSAPDESSTEAQEPAEASTDESSSESTDSE